MSSRLDAHLGIDGRVTCEVAGVHIPGVYNPWPDATACVCGEVWWRGHAGGWHSHRVDHVTGTNSAGRPTYKPGPWQHFFLHAGLCERHDIDPGFEHRCVDTDPVSAAEFWGRSS